MKTRKLLRKILPAGWLPYLLHLRPRAWPIVAAHMSVGFLLANGFDLTTDALHRWLLAVLAWPVLGNAGTLAINSVYDQDEGDIGYLDEPPPPPRHLLPLSLVCMLVGLAVATAVGPRFVVAYLICFALSLLYSVPPFRLKARAGFDLLINSTGYGALTLYAGWAATARPVEPPIVNVVLGFFFLFAGFYPLTQIYQMAEDQRRGDVTLALRLGKQNTLRFAMVAVSIAFAFTLGEVWLRFRQVRSTGTMLALGLWAMVLVPWIIHHDRVDTAYEQRGFYRALWVWAVTDVSVVLAMAPV
jgi:4-hydroxybenzoate polyprenyltransferase